jgi:hypothetical protein
MGDFSIDWLVMVVGGFLDDWAEEAGNRMLTILSLSL